jgi:hypothetical protein
LSQGDSIFSIASGYKIGRSTASVVLRETMDAIWEALNNLVFKKWTENYLKRISEDFITKWDFPHTIGAIDGKHVNIKCPNNSGSSFFNYKKNFSIILMAVSIAHYNFTYIDVGAYGSQSDGGVFRNCSLGKALYQNKIPVPPQECLPQSNIDMPHFFVADDAFSLGKYIMKPFKGLNLSDMQLIFNYRLSRARRIIENAFGILVARWQIFTRTITCSPQKVDKIIKASVCLHNFIKKLEYNIHESRKKYCSKTFCDKETDDGVIPGEWRREVGTSFNVILRDTQKIGKGGNNPGTTALNLRNGLGQYLISPAGSIPNQIKHINRGKKLRNLNM